MAHLKNCCITYHLKDRFYEPAIQATSTKLFKIITASYMSWSLWSSYMYDLHISYSSIKKITGKKKKEKGELDRLGFSRAHTYKTRILR